MKSWTLIDWAIYLILCLVCGYFNGQLSLIQMEGFLLSLFNVSDDNEKLCKCLAKQVGGVIMTQRHMTMCHLERKEDPYADTDIFPFA